MFTGLIEEIGRIARLERRGPGARVAIDAAMAPLVLGESIAVDGVCLTVDRIVPGGFEADASIETLERTTLGRSGVVRAAAGGRSGGSRVHLERATPLGGRMGGHIVAGHVDGIGAVTAAGPAGDAWRIALSLGRELAPFVAEKGSIAIDGVSLTLNACRDRADHVEVELVIVPHTRRATKLDALRPGERVNVEVDVLARYVARQLALGGAGAAGARAPGRDEALDARARDDDPDERLRRKLREGGFG
jgi:riboflavin synthase